MGAALLENRGTQPVLISLLEPGLQDKRGQGSPCSRYKRGVSVSMCFPAGVQVKWKCGNCHDLMNGQLLPGCIGPLVLL